MLRRGPQPPSSRFDPGIAWQRRRATMIPRERGCLPRRGPAGAPLYAAAPPLLLGSGNRARPSDRSRSTPTLPPSFRRGTSRCGWRSPRQRPARFPKRPRTRAVVLHMVADPAVVDDVIQLDDAVVGRAQLPVLFAGVHGRIDRRDDGGIREPAADRTAPAIGSADRRETVPPDGCAAESARNELARPAT